MIAEIITITTAIIIIIYVGILIIDKADDFIEYCESTNWTANLTACDGILGCMLFPYNVSCEYYNKGPFVSGVI